MVVEMGNGTLEVAPDESQPSMFLVLVDPVEDEETRFLSWYANLHRSLLGAEGLLRIRHLRLAAEQLLPNRAANASHRYAASYEFETREAMMAAAGRLHPARGVEAAAIVDLPRVRCAAFVQIAATVMAPRVPKGAPARPQPVQDLPRWGTGTFMAFTRPVSPAADADYNTWYDEHHLPETLLLEGVRHGRRYRRIASPPALAGRPVIMTPYLTIYELDNVGAVPFNRDMLLDWLADVTVEHLGPPAYDRAFTQAFVHQDVGDL